MTAYSTPTDRDLALYMGDDRVRAERAQMLISHAETLCRKEYDPLPAGAEVVVIRVAARAYVTIASASAVQRAQQENPYAAVPAAGRVTLLAEDYADLSDLAGSTSEVLKVDYFSIRPGPPTFGGIGGLR